MKYPVNIAQDGETLFVSFPDVPEALTCGDNLDDALTMAYDALLNAFSFYFEEVKAIPMPSNIESEYYIHLPVSVISKIYLLNAMVATGVNKSELGRKVGVKKQNINQLLDVTHSTKIDTVEKALNALGKESSIVVS